MIFPGISHKKNVVTFLIALLYCTALHALPGLQQYLPDAAGDYVYYRDYSFKEPSYVGFLKYDNSSYSARFIQVPAEGNLKNIQILFTLNPESSFFDMTGEKVVTEVSAADVETLNYLHDIMYEFHSRRKKTETDPTGKNFTLSTEFPQFGGLVTMSYSVFIPLFGIDKISRNDKILFELVCINTLINSEDTSFTDFAGFSQPPAGSKLTARSAKEQKEISNKIETSWSQISESAWISGEDAFLFSVDTELQEKEFETTAYSASDFLIRYLLRTNPGSFLYYPSLELKEGKNYYQLSFLQYAPNSQTYTNDFKLIQKKSNSVFTITGLSVINSFYQDNYFYFDQKLDSLRQ